MIFYQNLDVFGATGSRSVLPKMCTPGGSSEQGCKRASATIKQPGKVASLHLSASFFSSNFSQVRSGRGCSCTVAFSLSNLLAFPVRLAKSFCCNSATVSESSHAFITPATRISDLKWRMNGLLGDLLGKKKKNTKKETCTYFVMWMNVAVWEEQHEDDALFSVVCVNSRRRPLSSSVSPGAAGWGEKRLRLASCWPSFCFRPRATVSPPYSLSSHINRLTPEQRSCA